MPTLETIDDESDSNSEENDIGDDADEDDGACILLCYTRYLWILALMHACQILQDFIIHLCIILNHFRKQNQHKSNWRMYF